MTSPPEAPSSEAASPGGDDERAATFVASAPPTSPAAADGTVAADGDGAADAPETQEKRGSFFRELPVLIIIALLLAFLLRTFIVQVFYIPSSSMVPTLEVNDRILVDKVTYRFREPRRGEIVVFEGERELPSEPQGGLLRRALRGFGQLLGIAPADARDFVKRVIGLPGDEVRIDEEGIVYVNGVALDEPYVANEDHREYGPVTVPEGGLFFLGDNRPNSSDSRFLLGFVQRDQVVGRAFLIIWPPKHAGLLRGPRYEPIPVPTGEPPPPTPQALPAPSWRDVNVVAPVG